MATLTAAPTSDFARRQMRERRFVEQFGKVGLALVLALAGAIFLIVPGLAVWHMTQTPFIGAFVEYPLDINRGIVEPFFPSTDSASNNTDFFQEQDHIIAM